MREIPNGCSPLRSTHLDESTNDAMHRYGIIESPAFQGEGIWFAVVDDGHLVSMDPKENGMYGLAQPTQWR